jgi:hypothetical protein
MRAEEITRTRTALFTRLYGHQPRKVSGRSYAEKELACLDLVDQAAEHFLAGRLAEFDARVGDKNCHILSHLLIELAGRAEVLGAVGRLAARTAAARQVLRGWDSQIGNHLAEVTHAAWQAGALPDLTSDQVLLTNAFVLKKIARDGDENYLRLVRRIGGRIAYERARISVNQVTDARIGTVLDATWAEWASRGADDLADDVRALAATLSRSWKLHTFLVRVPYSSLAMLVDRAWQQNIRIAIRSHVLLPDHQHLVTLLYTPNPDRYAEFDQPTPTAWPRDPREPVVVILGLSDVTGSFRDIAVDEFYRIRHTMPVRSDSCRCGASRLVTERISALDLADLATAGEAVRPESANAVRMLTAGVPTAARSRFAVTFARRAELARTAGMHAGDASGYRLIHVFPDWIGNLSRASP